MYGVEVLRRELLDKLRILRERYRGSKKLSVISLLKTLSKHACERKAKYLLEEPDFNAGIRFDPYYKQKSNFATLKILELLKSRLQANGLDASILTEVPSDIGRYDVAIVQGQPCRVYNCLRSEKVRIEVKASLGLDFEQLDRYLWDSSPIILARVITRHVAKLKPSKLKQHIYFSLKELNAKADRLLSHDLWEIPGKDCMSCSDFRCPHNSNTHCRTQNMITMSDAEFNDDLNALFRNLSYVANRTVDLAIEELIV